MDTPTQDPTPTPEARAQALRLAREALAQAIRRVEECSLAVCELDNLGDSPYARMLKARFAGDQQAERAAEIEWWTDLHELTGCAPPVEFADAVTTLLAERRLAREH